MPPMRRNVTAVPMDAEIRSDRFSELLVELFIVIPSREVSESPPLKPWVRVQSTEGYNENHTSPFSLRISRLVLTVLTYCRER